METSPELSPVVTTLPSYPMEQLNAIKRQLQKAGKKIYDFGTGDPKIPLWTELNDTLKKSLADYCQYPTIYGKPELQSAIWSYLKRRFGIAQSDQLMVLPTNGSKEAVFNTMTCIVGRKGRKRVIFPKLGYPIYRSGTLFAGGICEPIGNTDLNGYSIEPWDLPASVIKDTAAVWVNYPHNPTGTAASESYYSKLVEWASHHDIIILSDECYADIYNEAAAPPLTLANFDQNRTIAFHSLSKRSGFTGYRSGFMVGPKPLLEVIARARANFGVGTPDHIQAAATKAWLDDEHVVLRRKIFTSSLEKVGQLLKTYGLIERIPQYGFYICAKIPASFGTDDVRFATELASHGVIVTPCSWLSSDAKGYFRMAMVPNELELEEALEIISSFLHEHS